jgi:hypothetical protein
MNAPGRFTAEAMTNVMHRIASHIDVPSADAQLLKLTNNAVFALPQAGLVIRITRSHRFQDRADKVVALARWFAAVDAPTIRLAGKDQPIRTGDLTATVWQYVPPTSPVPTVEELGRTLRVFHGLETPPMNVPMWDPIGDARRRLVDAESLAHDHRQLIEAWCDRIEPAVAAFRDHSSKTLVHGDAHVGNLLRSPSGRVLLCDFDATCLGPWQVDLAAVAVGEARFGRVGTYRALATAYGRDVTDDPAWPVVREARELKMIAAAVPLLASTPGIADEFERRLCSAMAQDNTATWIPFADIRGTA